MLHLRFHKSGVSQDQSSSRLAIDPVQIVCKAPSKWRTPVFSLFSVFWHSRMSFSKLQVGLVAGTEIFNEIRRRSRAMSHELGINAVQLFT